MGIELRHKFQLLVKKKKKKMSKSQKQGEKMSCCKDTQIQETGYEASCWRVLRFSDGLKQFKM